MGAARRTKAEVVVITGASAGVGRAVAREFAARGARIALLARGAEGLEAARQEVEELGGTALVLPTDVADHDQVEQAATAVEVAFGPIDVWINNAMTSVFARFIDTPVEEFRRVNEVTYLGYVHGTMAALRRMLPRDRGTIVQVGSGVAYRGIPLQSAYSGAKHGIQGFTDSVRAELRHEKSRVWITAVHLPSVNTPQFSWVKARIPQRPRPLPPVLQPEVAARAVYWAAHHRRREVLVGLPVTALVTLNKIVPGFLDWYLARSAVTGQMYDGPPGPDWRDYVWEPVEEDRGAHGDFDSEAHERSMALWLSLHRRAVALGLSAAAAALIAGGRAATRRKVGEAARRAAASGAVGPP